MRLMNEPTFANLKYQGKKRKTRRELFLERMDALIPWQLLETASAPSIPRPEREDSPTRCPSC